MSAVRRVLRRVLRCIHAAMMDDDPAPYVRFYTTNQTTLRGYLVGQHARYYELAQPESLHEGMQRWQAHRDRARLRIPREAVDYYVLER